MPEQVTEKDKILYFTHAKFITEGFYKTTMDEIARDLQISKKTIYKHFQSKDVLLQSVCDMRVDFLHEKIIEIVESGDDAVTKFLKMINLNKTIMMNCSQSWFKDLQVHAPHCLKKFNDVRDNEVMNVLARLIEQGKREKMIQSVPSQVLIAAMMGAIDSVTKSDFILNSKYSFHDAIRITAEIFFNGFLTDAGKEKFANTKKLFENVLQ
jgi:AcrR family transcriptional regulator